MASPVAQVDLPLVEVALLTGSDPAAVNQTGAEYGVDGTDLGSSFLYNDLTYIVFGDTFDIAKADWRCNVLAISSDDDPSDGITFDRMIEDRPGHDRRYAMDTTKIETQLGWSPTETFESGLERTVEWYLDNRWWWRPIRETHQQKQARSTPVAAQ